MENKNQYSDQKLKKFKKNIEDKIRRVKKELNGLQTHQLDQKKYIAQADMSFSDDARRFENRAMVDTMVTRLKKKLKELKSALNRIENKTYGICKKTGTLISEQRLEAIPTAVLSMNAKRTKKAIS